MLHQNYNVKHLNTFGIDVKANYFLEINGVGDYVDYLNSSSANCEKCLVLGGGSNLLFLNNYHGLIIHPTKKDINLVKEDEKNVWAEVSAAVEWDHFVEWSVENGFGGIENLTDIPGNVGASPVQNIGAYGVEAKDTVDSVKGFYLKDGLSFELDNSACQFGYRDSIFKRVLKDKVVITSVIYKLKKIPSYQLSYGNLKEKVDAVGEVNLKNVRTSVREIRAGKLPDTKEHGNAGSFFKNPVIALSQFKRLQQIHPTIPGYTTKNECIKLPAAWLIDQCGLKGKRVGGAQVYSKQPLVIINTGGATGNDIYDLAQFIIKSVLEKFNIIIHPEVNIIS